MDRLLPNEFRLWSEGAQGLRHAMPVADVFDRPIQSQEDLESALEKLRDTLQKLIDEGNAIILE